MRYKFGLDDHELCVDAKNGKEALEAVIENTSSYNNKMCSFSLILMDCNMPIMDGYEATE